MVHQPGVYETLRGMFPERTFPRIKCFSLASKSSFSKRTQSHNRTVLRNHRAATGGQGLAAPQLTRAVTPFPESRSSRSVKAPCRPVSRGFFVCQDLPSRLSLLIRVALVVVICTRDREQAFYRDTLGLSLVREDSFAAVFNAGGISLRVSTVPAFAAHEHTIVGFTVSHVESVVKALRREGSHVQHLSGVQSG
jgi:hypothetical protein